ncbi:GNAT family N-acetyltransferase [Streptomyces sp. NBC_01003]|uniref:GNAT family N-acetyltransferase n=1 Tax=Streptomyces sp. NBC_01003 TaxID=2903714 RepID=UPI003870B942|nr:GNAT family N-acetyltransferase [Streptomyces sp. NBC_01003]
MQKSDIRRARTVDELTAAGPLFDGPALPELSARFLRAPGHHLFLAYEGDEPVGFVSGIETVHPDKGVEMFLYELSVAEAHRRRGIGRSLVEALATLARERGCYGMWVGVDTDNEPALATYRGAGGEDGGGCAVIEWSFVRAEPG